MKKRTETGTPPEVSIEQQKFIDPAIAALELVGSRGDIEIEMDKLKREGHKIIGVRGYPLAPLPPHIQQAAKEAVPSHFSPPSKGLWELRQALARRIEAQYGATSDPEEEILVTYGAMHGLHVTLTALLGPADEALLVSPCYFFGGVVKLTRANPVYVEAEEKDGYALDFEKIRKSVSRRTKLIVLSSPVNPTGYIYTRADVEQFIALAEEHNLLLVSDESYDRMIYDGLEHFSPFHYPEGRRRTILVKSFTKSYALPTWRVGYVVADASLTPYFRKVLEWTMLSGANINQRVALAALEGPQDWLLEVSREFERCRNQLLEGIRNVESFSCITPHGGPFIFLNVSRYGENSNETAKFFLHQYGIPAIPGKYFRSRTHVRIPFGGSEEAVAALVSALADAGRLNQGNERTTSTL